MKKSLIAVGLILGMSSLAQASNGKISFDGTIRDTACSISAADLDQTVSFGDIAKSLVNAGGRSAPQTITIELKSCSKGTLANINTTLNGPAAGAGNLARAFGVSGVQNAGILIEQNGTAVIPNSTVSQPLQNGDNTITFQASVIGNNATGTGTDVTEGTFSSTVNFSIAYI